MTDAPAPVSSRRPRPASLSCVLPCRNEADNLGELLPVLLPVLGRCAQRWEVIIVDDGSTDGSDAVWRHWSIQPGIKVLQLSRNFGKEAALSAGLQEARGDVVVFMDADLQHAPDLLERFIAHWQDGADVAYAVRENRDDEATVKRLGTGLFYRLVNASGRFDVPAGAGDFRLMDRSVVDALLSLPERNRFMKGLYAWVGFKSVAVPYLPPARSHGRSHYGNLQLLRLSLAGITAFTNWPLRAVSLAGLLIACGAFAYGAFLTIEHFLFGHDISGWTTIVVSLMLFSGIQLISLGIVGEYIGRIFEEVKGRPLYVVRRRLGQGLDPLDR